MRPFPDDTDYSEPFWDSDTVTSYHYSDDVADEKPTPPLMTLADYRIVDNRIAKRANVIARQPQLAPVGYPDILMLDSMSRPPPVATCRG